MQQSHLDPKVPVPAATIILTRQQAGEFQVYLLKRSVKSGFMGGYYVFPGGVVDPDDRDIQTWKDHVDLDFDTISRRFGSGLPAGQALAYGVAAIRETLEEAGVFLGRRTGRGANDLARIGRLRRSKTLAKNWFKHLTVSEKWTLELSALARWSHWITPELMKRRYDTRFFLAPLPSGQACQPDARETTHGIWIHPRQALVANMAGKIPLSPPTLVTLHGLLDCTSLANAQSQAGNRGWGDTILPRLVPLDGTAVIVEPWDPMYGREKIEIDVARLARKVLPVGRPFSRLWDNAGIWLPVAF